MPRFERELSKDAVEWSGETIDEMLNKIVIKLIFFYQRTISYALPPSCRFTPTCSEYARQAFVKYSFFKAFGLSVKRILKCHPFHEGGNDPVP